MRARSPCVFVMQNDLSDDRGWVFVDGVRLTPQQLATTVNNDFVLPLYPAALAQLVLINVVCLHKLF